MESARPATAAAVPATGAAALIGALGRGLPDGRLVIDPDVLAAISHDEAEWAPVGRAAAGVRARTEAEVRHVVRTCAEFRAPVVPRGAGTGLSGGANAADGSVVLDLSGMNQVLEIDRDNMTCVVQPGVVNNDLKAAVAASGLWYPPDPASAPWSTIGGNVATNAGGLCCLKYGVTRDYVLGLRVVTGAVPGTADGEAVGYGDAVRLGRRTSKGVAGLDLTGLFVGSEGTLGVVTEVTLRLRPALTGTPRTVVGAFGDLVSAGEAVSLITRRGLSPSVLELLDRACLTAVEEWKHLGLEADAAALLLARVDTPGELRRRGGGRARRGDVRRGRAVGGAVHRRHRGRGAVRRAAARLPGAGTARPGAHRGRLRSPVGRSRHARADRGDRAPGTASRSRRSPTPATATCTRCSSPRPGTRKPGSRRRRPSPSSSTRRSSWAGPCPVSTASACSSGTACAASSTRARSPCRRPSAARSTRSASSTRARADKPGKRTGNPNRPTRLGSPKQETRQMPAPLTVSTRTP